MKKMTKILSLALALALVLGMTAFADEPSTLIMYDDFSDVTDLTFDKFAETRSSMAATTGFTENASTLFADAPEGQTKFYFGSKNPTFTKDENGNVSLVSTNSGYQLAYRLATPWTYTENSDRLLVFSVNMEYDNRTGAETYYSTFKHLHKSKTVDASNTEGTYAGYAVNEDGSLKLTEGNGVTGKHALNLMTNYSGEPGFHFLVTSGNDLIPPYSMKFGETFNVTQVFAPYKVGYNTNPLTHLGVSQHAGYSHRYGQSIDLTDKIEEVLGFKLRAPSKLTATYDDVKIYSISKKAADIYIDTVNTKADDIALDESFEIIFSQPILKQRLAFNGSVEWDLVNSTTVTAGDKTLVVNEDYTIDVSEKIMGNAVKGVVTIKPLKDWDYETTYTVTFTKGRVLSQGHITMPNANSHSIDITTQAAPSFDISIAASEGLAAGGNAVTAETAAGKTVFVKATASNTTGRDVNGVIVIGIYDAEGNLVKYAAASNKAFADGASESFAASFKIAEGQKVKAYVRDTASALELQ